jgi:hypothetical protein
MRKKRYYTDEEIITDQYTIGQQYMTNDRIEYIGLYHKYLTGEIYTERIYIPNKSRILVPYETESADVKFFRLSKSKTKTKFQTPKQYNISITTNNIKNKSLTRNILKNVSTNQLIEIDSKTVNLYRQKKIDNNLYQLITFKWVITGPVNTVNENGVTKLGVVEQNINEIQKKSKEMPELLQYISSYSQYYTDTTYTTLNNIN